MTGLGGRLGWLLWSRYEPAFLRDVVRKTCPATVFAPISGETYNFMFRQCVMDALYGLPLG